MMTLCPKCGNVVTQIALTCYPPRYQSTCMRCGWTGTDYVQKPRTRTFIGRCDSCGRCLYDDMDRYAAKLGQNEMWLCDSCVTLVSGEKHV